MAGGEVTAEALWYVVDRAMAHRTAIDPRVKAAVTALPQSMQEPPRVVAAEATGGFETVVAASLGAAGLPVVVVNPAQVRSFAQALGRRAKTDPIDAVVIAHFAEAVRLEARPLWMTLTSRNYRRHNRQQAKPGRGTRRIG